MQAILVVLAMVAIWLLLSIGYYSYIFIKAFIKRFNNYSYSNLVDDNKQGTLQPVALNNSVELDYVDNVSSYIKLFIEMNNAISSVKMACGIDYGRMMALNTITTNFIKILHEQIEDEKVSPDIKLFIRKYYNLIISTANNILNIQDKGLRQSKANGLLDIYMDILDSLIDGTDTERGFDTDYKLESIKALARLDGLASS